MKIKMEELKQSRADKKRASKIIPFGSSFFFRSHLFRFAGDERAAVIVMQPSRA